MFAQLSARQLYAGAVALVVTAVVIALYLQHALGVKPCPLCILQRMGYIVAALLASCAALVGAGRSRVLFGSLSVFAAVAGGGVAAWQTWLLAHPPEQLGCGRPFEWFNDDFPLVTWLPRLFRGEGDCLAVDWTFLGLAVPHLSLITYAGLLLLLVWATKRAWSEPRRRPA